jgi:hypothetical protein
MSSPHMPPTGFATGEVQQRLYARNERVKRPCDSATDAQCLIDVATETNIRRVGRGGRKGVLEGVWLSSAVTFPMVSFQSDSTFSF